MSNQPIENAVSFNITLPDGRVLTEANAQVQRSGGDLSVTTDDDNDAMDNQE